MTAVERRYIEASMTLMVVDMRHANPQLTPGEIYDAIAEELEKRCQRIIQGESFTGEE